MSVITQLSPGDRLRARLIGLLSWLAQHRVPCEYAELADDGVEIGLGADGDAALGVAAATADALTDSVITVRLYPGCARITISGATSPDPARADIVHATLAVREADGEAYGALVTALAGLALGRERPADAATLRAAAAAIPAPIPGAAPVEPRLPPRPLAPGAAPEPTQQKGPTDDGHPA